MGKTVKNHSKNMYRNSCHFSTNKQTNIYCRHSATAAIYSYICILYIIYCRAVVGISTVEWQIFIEA